MKDTIPSSIGSWNSLPNWNDQTPTFRSDVSGAPLPAASVSLIPAAADQISMCIPQTLSIPAKNSYFSMLPSLPPELRS